MEKKPVTIKSIGKSIKEKAIDIYKWEFEFIGIILALISYHVFQYVLWLYDEKSVIITLDYLGTIFVSVIYVLAADFIATMGMKMRWKPLYKYYRQVKKINNENNVEYKTQFTFDIQNSFHPEKEHLLKRIWILQRTYYIYFVCALVVFAILNL